MEDFSSARTAEQNQVSALQNEWMERQSIPKFELAAQKAEDGRPGKDVADRLDRELKDFADTKMDNASSQMKDFQKLVAKFGEADNKKDAVKEFGPAAAKLRVSLENDAIARFKEMDKEAAKVPGRKALEQEFSNKSGKMFDQAAKLPGHEYEQFLTLLEFKKGENADQRAARVHDGLANRPDLQKLFDESNQARLNVEASKSPKEKELASTHKRDIDEAHTIRDVVRKVAIRSDIVL